MVAKMVPKPGNRRTKRIGKALNRKEFNRNTRRYYIKGIKRAQRRS